MILRFVKLGIGILAVLLFLLVIFASFNSNLGNSPTGYVVKTADFNNEYSISKDEMLEFNLNDMPIEIILKNINNDKITIIFDNVEKTIKIGNSETFNIKNNSFEVKLLRIENNKAVLIVRKTDALNIK